MIASCSDVDLCSKAICIFALTTFIRYLKIRKTKKLQKTYQSEIESSMKEYQTKLQTYSADTQNQTEVTNQARAKELQGMEQNIQQYQQTASQDIQQKQADLLRPLIEKARAAIQKVAREQGFVYVIDATPGGALILSDGKDLIADVKKELGF